MSEADITAFVLAESDIACQALKLTLADIDCLKIVGFATDGLSAIEQIVNLRPDVALISSHTSLMDGLNVVKQIRSQPNKTRIVFIAQMGEDDLVAAAMQSGANAFCYEPAFATLELLAAIRTALGSSHASNGKSL